MLKVALRNKPSKTRLYVIPQAPYQVQTPEDPPEDSIPPKPPYGDCCTSRALIGHNDRPPHEIRHQNKRLPLLRTTIQCLPTMIHPQANQCTLPPMTIQDMMTTALLQQHKVMLADTMVGSEQRQQWEHLAAFHAITRPWPANIVPQGVEGSLPLIRAIFYPIAGTRLLTYAWIEDEANTSEIDCDNNSATARFPFSLRASGIPLPTPTGLADQLHFQHWPKPTHGSLRTPY